MGSSLGSILGGFGRLLDASWPFLGASWALWGASWVPLGRPLGALGRLLGASWGSWAPLGRILVDLGSILKGFREGLGGFWVRSGPQNKMQPGHQCLQRAQFSSHLSFLTSSRQVASAGCAKRKQSAASARMAGVWDFSVLQCTRRNLASL